MAQEDCNDEDFSSSVTPSVVAAKLEFDLKGFSLNEPGITSTPNKPTVDKFIAR